MVGAEELREVGFRCIFSQAFVCPVLNISELVSVKVR